MRSSKEFLKKLRPEEFSDSFVIKTSQLDEGYVSYYLETLTNRSQEKAFEQLCKRIAEKEICPNLISQTGPTGGGDSKVDSETYPVTEQTSFKWFSGLNSNSASERWGFAFSAKKEWRAKVKSDIKNIASTNRDYKRIYFMSNQYIPDKKRAALEDELTEEYEIDVRILDKQWFIDKIFNSNCSKIFVEAFDLSQSLLEEKRIGPNDYNKKLKLDELEASIDDCISKNLLNYDLVEKALKAAIISREIELNSTDVYGKFYRAEKLAKKYGNEYHLKNCIYEWAWTSFWWTEDYDEFYKKYKEYESLVLGSSNFNDLDKLTNLWFNLTTIDKNENWEKHTEILKMEFSRMINDEERPNAAHSAKVRFVFIQIMLGESVSEQVKKLINILNSDIKNMNLDLGQIFKMCSEISMIKQSENYNELFELMIGQLSKYKQELEASRLLLDRGYDEIKEKPYKAIKYIGRAVTKLYKEDSKSDFFRALYLLGIAFEKVDLNWAARGYHLNAFLLAFNEYSNYGNFSPILLASSSALKNLENKLGRLPQALEWKKLNDILTAMAGYENEKLEEDNYLFDFGLGAHFFKLNKNRLNEICWLPNILEDNGLTISATFLKYMLGYVDEELLESNFNNDINSYHDFMIQSYHQPINKQISRKVSLGNEDQLELHSKILGTKIVVQTENNFLCSEIGTSILAALESFLATGIQDSFISTKSELIIKVRSLRSDGFNLHFDYTEKLSSGFYDIQVINPDKIVNANELQIVTKKFTLDIIVDVTSRILIFKNHEKQLSNLIQSDEAIDRAINFTGSLIAVRDFFGVLPFTIDHFKKDDMECYTFLENNTHIEKLRGSQSPFETKKEDREIEFVEEFMSLNHSNMEVVSLVNIPLWDQAKWRGVGFLINSKEEMYITLMFENKEAGEEIFKQWIEMIDNPMNKDGDNLINIGIIKGVDKRNPYHYKTVISSGLPKLNENFQHTKAITTTSRVHLLTPNSNQNLKNIEMYLKKEEHKEYKYSLIPGYVNNGKPNFNEELAILKKELDIKDAWKIDRSNWLSSGIHPDDNPIIPKGINSPPIKEVLREFKKRNK
ncbi:hypothetical protein [Bacillus massiliglaciei]|uniref:hypothetical protein n=1 Tax=Bacillus massiliglaciei TaxID=1816693 RepID=UPI000AE49A47|nr:hypothetical protein [Bacillus massiliglaciei]